MLNLGTVRPGSTIYLPFDTFAGSTGASITMTGLAVGDIQIYKGSSMTQRASTAGFTLIDTDGTDIDATTGLHMVSIDLSDNTTAGFYTAGSVYNVAIASVTVDSQTVNFWLGRFEIGYPDAIINTTINTLSTQTSFTLTNGPAEASALIGCPVIIHDVASAVQLGHAVISGYAATTKTVTLTAGTTFTAAAGDNISIFPPSNSRWFNSVLTTSAAIGSVTGAAGSVTGAVGSVTGNVGGNVVGSVASVTGAVGSVTGNVGGNVVGSVASVTGAVGSVTGNVGGNVVGSVGSLGATAKSDVNAEVVDSLATDTYTEPSQGAPTTTPTLAEMWRYLYFALINEAQVDSAAGYKEYYNNAGTTMLWRKQVADTGGPTGTYTENTGVTGV